MNRRRFLKSCAAVSTGLLFAPPLLRRAWASDVKFLNTPVSRYGLICDGGFSPSMDASLRSSLHASGIMEIILGGDNLYDMSSSLDATWNPWKAEGFNFPVVTIGNHTPGYDQEVSYFNLPGEYYAKRDGASLFLVLNSDNDATGKEQAAWLRDQLQTTDAQFVFVIYHHPPFDVGPVHHWQERGSFQLAVRPVLRDFASKITAIFNGHEHVAGIYDANGIPMIVSGAVVDLRPAHMASANIDGLQFNTHWIYSGSQAWMRLDVNPDENTAWINFVDIKSNRVTVSAEVVSRPFNVQSHVARASTGCDPCGSPNQTKIEPQSF